MKASFVVAVAVSAGALFGVGCNSAHRTGPGTQGPDLAGEEYDAAAPVVGDDAGPMDYVDGGVLMTGDPTTCAEAMTSKSYIGCDYYPTVTANAVIDVFDYAVVVSNPGANMANVTVTGAGMTTPKTAQVAPGALVKIGLPWVAALLGPQNAILANSVFSTGGAYHLVSDVPVLVYQFNPLEYTSGSITSNDLNGTPWYQACLAEGQFPCYSYSNDASLLLPSTAMTDNYVITGISGDDMITTNSNGQNPMTTPYLGSYAVITATTNSTTVKIQLSASADIVASTDNKIVATPQNTTSPSIATFMLNQGDVVELMTSAGSAHDLTGSIVSASSPVQVIVGNQCTTDPTETEKSGQSQPMYTCDHVEESVLPIETWGTEYVVTGPSGPNGNEPGHTVRIYGGIKTANLTYTPAITGAPATIAPGAVVRFNTTTDFVVSGDNAFQVSSEQLSGQIVDPTGVVPNQKGDPSLSFFAATAQYRVKYLFLAPTDYDTSYVDIVVPTGGTVTLDGTAVTTTPTPVGTSYGVLRLPLAAGSQAGAHTLTGSMPFGIQVEGYGSYTSYQYPGGLDLKQITTAPPPID